MLHLSLASPLAGYNPCGWANFASIRHLFASAARLTRALAAPALLASLLGCADGRAKSEAAAILRQVDLLRMADNHAKRQPLDQLRALPCTAPDRCDARDRCAAAFHHHVRGVELSTEVEHALKAGIAPDSRDEIARKLLEASVENEQGQHAMPACEKAVADLRVKFRL